MDFSNQFARPGVLLTRWATSISKTSRIVGILYDRNEWGNPLGSAGDTVLWSQYLLGRRYQSFKINRNIVGSK